MSNRLGRAVTLVILVLAVSAAGAAVPLLSEWEDPSFSADIQEIFERHSCTRCHGKRLAAGLDLRSGSSYDNLVGVTATSEPRVRVVPGDPASSYLMIKLEGRQEVGERMPRTGEPLSEADLAYVRDWIARGAKNN